MMLNNAAANGHIDVVKLLLDKGASANGNDAMMQHLDVVRRGVISTGIPVDRSPHQPKSPLTEVSIGRSPHWLESPSTKLTNVPIDGKP